MQVFRSKSGRIASRSTVCVGEPKIRDWFWAYCREVSGSLHKAVVNLLLVVFAYMLSGGNTMLERSSLNEGPFEAGIYATLELSCVLV